VTNKGDARTTFVEVSAAFYDSNGRIVDTASGYTSPEHLEPGQTAAFEILSVSPNGHSIRSTSANADSTEYANAPEFPLVALLAAGAIGGTVILTRIKSYKR